MSARWMIVCLFSLALVACGDDQQAPADPPTTATAPAPAAAAPPTADEVPVPEDFAERAETEVTGENYRAQLDAVEGELAAQ